jgi:hypothetical protein
LPYIAAHHAIHAEPHLTGRIPLNQIILHNPKSVPFRAYKAYSAAIRYFPVMDE